MTTQSTDSDAQKGAGKYKRRVRNYLLDVGLQLRYTTYIVVVGAALTAGLGFKIYDATRDTSKIISMTNLVEPAVAGELQAQFAANDRTVLWSIVGFGVVLVLGMTGVGIVITHKIAGPLFKISHIMQRIRDNKLGPPIRDLRKGDELREFHDAFREMHDAIRARTEEEVRTLSEAITALEDAGQGKLPSIDRLRHMLRQKEDSMEGSGLHQVPNQ